MELKDLKKDLAYKWKPQECKQYGATMVAYIDSRDVQDLLDKVCGQCGWQDRYIEIKGRVFCEIGIKCGDEWVWKGDCGTDSNFEAEKGASSDAFKRAAVKWGVGRFLYSLGIVKLKTEEYKKKFYPAVNGKIVWDKAELNGICNGMVGKKTEEPKDDDEPDFVKDPPSGIKDKPAVAKKYKALKKPNATETACLAEIMMGTVTLQPKDLNVGDFKRQRAINIFAKFGRWPKDSLDVTSCMEFLQLMYGKVGK